VPLEPAAALDPGEVDQPVPGEALQGRVDLGGFDRPSGAEPFVVALAQGIAMLRLGFEQPWMGT
jgi:hypothetical protein